MTERRELKAEELAELKQRRVADWERLVGGAFGFLTEHGFHLAPELSRSEWYTTLVVYLSQQTAIQIERSEEFGRAELKLHRLRDGELPGPLIWVTADPIDEILFDNVLEARAPDRLAIVKANRGLSPEAVDKQLTMWAQLLREVAPEFSDGGLTAFDDGERVIREHVRQRPQQLKTYMPENASEDEMQREYDKTRRTTPPEVEVVMYRYKPKPARDLDDTSSD